MNQKHRFRWVILGGILLLIIGISYIVVQSQCQDAQFIQDDDTPKEYQILFIGNSYTFSNDLPQIFAKLAQSGGYDMSTAMLAEGGWTLNKHSQSKETIERIQGQSWDHVILQEQSVIPTNPEERQQFMYPAIRLLHKEVEEMGGEVILFMTWGRQSGLPESSFRDFREMQVEVEQGYQIIADELELMVSPVGTAWQNALNKNPHLELWGVDGSHPNMIGTYLAACVFYAVIYQDSPEGLVYTAGLDLNTAQSLQWIAAKTVFEDLERWNIK